MSEPNAQTVEPIDAPAVEPLTQKTFDDSYVKSLRDEAAANRIRAKAAEDELIRLRAVQEETERKDLERRGEFEKLYTESNTIVETLKMENAKLKEFHDAQQAAQETARQTALLKLPETMRSTYASATFEQIDSLVALIATQSNSSPHGTRNPPKTGVGANSDKAPAIGQAGWLERDLAENPTSA